MLSISHSVTGAFIAVKIGNPILAIPLILLSHYVEDAIPHWDVGTGMGKGLKSPALALRHEIIDLAATGFLLLLMYPHLGFRIWDLGFWSSAPVWGAFFGLLPDFLEAPRNFLHYESRWLAPLTRFHASFHHSITDFWAGLAPQFLLLIILWFLR